MRDGQAGLGHPPWRGGGDASANNSLPRPFTFEAVKLKPFCWNTCSHHRMFRRYMAGWVKYVRAHIPSPQLSMSMFGILGFRGLGFRV